MAKTELNSALKTISGGIDNWIYRRVDGKTVIRRRSTITHAPSEAQAEVRERFRVAAGYARAAMANPALREIYAGVARSKRMPVFAVMLTDFLKPPVVDAIDLTGYHGAVGDPITVRASDDVGVVAVSIAIRSADLTVLEQGAAVFEGRVWIYHATTARVVGEPVTIAATALDRPGHAGTRTESWS